MQKNFDRTELFMQGLHSMDETFQESDDETQTQSSQNKAKEENFGKKRRSYKTNANKDFQNLIKMYIFGFCVISYSALAWILSTGLVGQLQGYHTQ